MEVRLNQHHVGKKSEDKTKVVRYFIMSQFETLRLGLIMRHHLDAGNLDRLFDEGSDIVEEDSYDYDLASARFLGRDIKNISSPATKGKLIEILEREANSKQGHKIALNVIQSDFYRNESYERVVEHFNSLLKGLSEQF